MSPLLIVIIIFGASLASSCGPKNAHGFGILGGVEVNRDFGVPAIIKSFKRQFNGQVWKNVEHFLLLFSPPSVYMNGYVHRHVDADVHYLSLFGRL
jgi:hypothetical protein